MNVLKKNYPTKNLFLKILYTNWITIPSYIYLLKIYLEGSGILIVKILFTLCLITISCILEIQFGFTKEIVITNENIYLQKYFGEYSFEISSNTSIQKIVTTKHLFIGYELSKGKYKSSFWKSEFHSNDWECLEKKIDELGLKKYTKPANIFFWNRTRP